MAILVKLAIFAKIASLWRFELDARSGALEAGDFSKNGEIGDFGKNCRRAGDNSNKRPGDWQFWQKSPEMHAMVTMAKLAKHCQPVVI